MVLQIEGVVVEDACWLRKVNESEHINLSELEAVLKGVGLAIKLDLKLIEVISDSQTVCGWLRSVLSEECRIRTHGSREMLVRRRLDVLETLCKEYDLVLKVSFVHSANNIADKLTRVPKTWIRNLK